MSDAENSRRGPLPQWTQVGGIGSPVFEATGDDGVVWRLSPADRRPDGQLTGWWLAPRDTPDDQSEFITREHGLYFALDMAGMKIAPDAVRVDPDGARRQLGLLES